MLLGIVSDEVGYGEGIEREFINYFVDCYLMV